MCHIPAYIFAELFLVLYFLEQVGWLLQVMSFRPARRPTDSRGSHQGKFAFQSLALIRYWLNEYDPKYSHKKHICRLLPIPHNSKELFCSCYNSQEYMHIMQMFIIQIIVCQNLHSKSTILIFKRGNILFHFLYYALTAWLSLLGAINIMVALHWVLCWHKSHSLCFLVFHHYIWHQHLHYINPGKKYYKEQPHLEFVHFRSVEWVSVDI